MLGHKELQLLRRLRQEANEEVRVEGLGNAIVPGKGGAKQASKAIF